MPNLLRVEGSTARPISVILGARRAIELELVGGTKNQMKKLVTVEGSTIREVWN